MAAYLAEVDAVGSCDLLERIHMSVNLNALTWVVSTHLDSVFPWSHQNDLEARLILLSPGRGEGRQGSECCHRVGGRGGKAHSAATG